MAYTEDDLTEAIIEYHKDRHLIETIEPEAFYNDYGMRGYPDLYVQFNRPADGLIESHLIEVKSEYAVKSATGANEIIRQFNKMRRHFYEDNDRPVPFPQFEWEEVVLVFELAFIPSEYTLLHLLDNREMYNEAINILDPAYSKLPSEQSNEGIHSGVEVNLTFRHPAAPGYGYSLVSKQTDQELPPDRGVLQAIKRLDTDLGQELLNILEKES